VAVSRHFVPGYDRTRPSGTGGIAPSDRKMFGAKLACNL
jgi:hypothetical protein